MLKDFAQWLLQQSRPEVVEVDGKNYATQGLKLINEGKPQVSAFTVRSLTGLVDYIKSEFDNDDNLIVHVESPTEVHLFDAVDTTGERRTYLHAKAMLPEITFDRYLDREKFNIQLQSCFVQSADRDELLQLISSVVEDESVKMVDNGVSQQVVTKQGVSLEENTRTKSEYALKPFRTFAEVSQPMSTFILRLREGANAALYGADGGAWELTAISNIREYLADKLAKEIADGRIKIIA